MPLRVTFDFLGDRQVDRVLAVMVDRVSDASPAFEAMGDRLAEGMQRQFGSEGGWGSGGWAPLSPRYAEWKADHYPGQPILQREGDLVGSLTERPFGIDDVGPQRAVFGTDVEYAKYHQAGTDRMPARPPLELPESERRYWLKIMQRFIIDGGTAP